MKIKSVSNLPRNLRPGGSKNFLQKCCCSKSSCKECAKYNLLSILTFSAVIFGIVLGAILKVSCPPGYWNERRVMYVGFPGQLFLSMMECMIIPLISSTIIDAVASVPIQYSKIMACKGALYYISMTLIAVAIGVTLVILIAPGKRAKGEEILGHKMKDDATTRHCQLPQDHLLDILRSLFPSNIVQATMQLPRTQIILKLCDEDKKTCREFKSCQDYEAYRKLSPKTTPPVTDLPTKIEFLNGPNFLGVIVYSIALAIAIVILGDKGQSLLAVVSGLAEAFLLMTTWISWISPIGIASMIAAEILREANLGEKAISLGYYILTVMSGFVIHGCIVLPGIYMIFTKKLPFKFIGHMSKALMTAFGTSSSSATVPVTIHCLEKRVKIDGRVVRFLIPMGATVNLAGTALYEAVGSIFIAQVSHRHLTFFEILVVSLTATLASIGAAGVPSAGVLTMVMVLRSIDLDPGLVTIVIGLDWILDRFQTVVNVLGDSFGVAIVYHWTSKKFDALTAPAAPTVTENDDDGGGGKTTTAGAEVSKNEEKNSPPVSTIVTHLVEKE